MNISSLFSSFIFSVIGLYVIRRGRKETNLVLIVLGILLMTYSYFTNSIITDWGFGFVLSGAAYYFWNT